MSRIKPLNTKLEQQFKRVIREEISSKFSTNIYTIKGRPDIVFKKDKVVVFIDSDFWHGWQYPRWKHKLKTRFWRNKIEATRARDKRTNVYLRRHGWKVVRVWEHQFQSNPASAISEIKAALKYEAKQ